MQSSAALVLPNELLLEIFSYGTGLDRLFLALTCKRLIVVSSMVTIMIPSTLLHRLCPDSCRAMLGLLHIIQPLDYRGQPKKSWAACCDCYRYRPKNKRYWKGKEKRYPAASPLTIEVGYGNAVAEWCCRGSSSYQCPECWCAESLRKWGHQTET